MTQIVRTYGDPVLRMKAAPITTPNYELQALAEEMLKTMHAKNGVGLAAQQIGKTIQICVIEIPPQYDASPETGERLNPHVAMPLIMLNPVITEKKGVQSLEEGCLSVPEISSPIQRAYEVTATYLDLQGRSQTLHAKGFLARAVQHELDHLNGMLFVDRLSPIKKISLSGKLKRLKKKTEEKLNGQPPA